VSGNFSDRPALTAPIPETFCPPPANRGFLDLPRLANERMLVLALFSSGRVAWMTLE
jgi:hypothetical protein